MKKAVIQNLNKLDDVSTEALNTICSNLSFAGKEMKKLVFTSCAASEGKTFLTLQVACELAARGKKVLFVDADIRHSVLVSRYQIELGNQPLGLIHYLTGQCGMEETVYETDIPNLYLIPAGGSSANPLPLLTSPEFQQLLTYCGEQFDLTLLDTAAIGQVIDAAEVARNCDGAVLVTRYRQTRARDLEQAKQQIEQANCPVIGCIINAVSLDSISARRNYGSLFGPSGDSALSKKKAKA